VRAGRVWLTATWRHRRPVASTMGGSLAGVQALPGFGALRPESKKQSEPSNGACCDEAAVASATVTTGSGDVALVEPGPPAVSAAAAPAAAATALASEWLPLERAVASEWERVLALAPGSVSLADGFLELGGESLLALRVSAAVQYLLLGGQAQEEDEGPEFGELLGAFAVAALLSAPSLADYCGRLRQHGHDLPSDGTEPGGCMGSSSTASPGVDCINGKGKVTWPALRAAAQRSDDGATAHLADLLARAPREEALGWCGAAPRGGTARPQFTTLHAAAQAGAADCLKLLLEWRARPTATEGGAAMTPAHYAAMCSADCLGLLLEAKAPLTVRDARGQSLIHAAARAGNCASLRLLLATLKQGRASGRRALRADEGTRGLLEWTDRWARSAVHWAALNGHADALQVLLDNGASSTPRLITAHQMAKRTHLTQEQPLALALRVHGAESPVARLLAAAADAAAAAADRASATTAPMAGSAPPTAGSLAAPATPAVAGVEQSAAAGRPRFLLTLGSEAGLDRLALWELRERLSATAVRRVQCRIFFDSAAPPGAFRALKSAEKLCTVVLHAAGEELGTYAAFPEGAAEPPERVLAQRLASAELWDAAVAAWRLFNGDVAPGGGPDGPGAPGDTPLTFKVTCRRTGSRFAQVPSQGLAVALASTLTAARGWRAQVRRPDLEVRVLLSDMDLLVDVPVLVQAAIPTGGGEVCSAGLAAPVAWAMARTAELKPGERVLDPTCGRAVILVEAALSWPACDYLGLDLDPEQLRGAVSNVRLGAAGSARLDLLHGDARRLPMPSGSVDAVICDMPFGKLHSTVEGCRAELYGPLLAEVDRVVRADGRGRAVLLSSVEQELWVLRAAGFTEAAVPGVEDAGVGLPGLPPPGVCRWVCVARRSLRLGFLEAVVLVLRRPAAEAGPEGQELAEGAAQPAGARQLPERSGRLWWESSSGRGDWAAMKVAERPPMQSARHREI